MKSITEEMRFRQRLCEYALKHGVTKAARRYHTYRQFVYIRTLQKSYTKGLLTLLTHRETSEAPAYFYRSCGRHP